MSELSHRDESSMPPVPDYEERVQIALELIDALELDPDGGPWWHAQVDQIRDALLGGIIRED